MSGGVIACRYDRKLASARTRASNAGYASASFAERSRSSAEVLAASAQIVSPGPSGCGANTRTEGSIVTSPCRTNPRSSITDLRNRPIVCTMPGALTPGAISTVSRMPPTRSRRSSTATVRPAFAR